MEGPSCVAFIYLLVVASVAIISRKPASIIFPPVGFIYSILGIHDMFLTSDKKIGDSHQYIPGYNYSRPRVTYGRRVNGK